MFDVHEEEVEDVEGLRGNFLFFIVVHDFLGKTYLIALFSVWTHDEDEPDDGAHKSTNVREVGVNLVEVS